MTGRCQGLPLGRNGMQSVARNSADATVVEE